MNYSFVILNLLGGLTLFLYGVTRLSLSLKKIAGDKMRKILERFTRNVLIALLSGTLVTVVLDSSSVTIILVIALIHAKLIPLNRALGVIMGANIGTTFSSQIMALEVEAYSAILLVIGFVMYFVGAKKRTLKYVGLTVFGFGLIFFGLRLMGDAAEPLKNNAAFLEWIETLENPWKGVLIGAALTAIIQSSSGTMGIVITMASQKIISLAVGVAVMLGAEIGTCADTLLASIGRSRDAVKAGLFHLFFNIVTVILGVIFHHAIAEFALMISPNNVARQIANAHVIFNITGVLIFIGFTTPIARALNYLLPSRTKIETKSSEH